MIITFIGNDGSGKTAIARKFKDILTNAGLSVEYREEFDYFLLKHVLRLFGDKKTGQIRNKFLKKDGTQKIPLYFKLWPMFVWGDLLFEYVWINTFKRKKIVIMDRYAYDFLMSWELLGYNTVISRWLYSIFPKADINFIMDVLSTIAYNRKKSTHDCGLDFYNVQRSRYLSLANRLNIKIVNTEKDISICLDEVIVEFRKYLIRKLSEEDKILLLCSYPYFKKDLVDNLKLDIGRKSLKWDYMLDMAVRNNVEFLLAQNLIKDYENVLQPETVDRLQRLISVCENRKKSIIDTLKVISKRFKEEDIEFIVFKTFPSFDYIPTDIDILVKIDDIPKAEEVLRQIFQEEISCKNHNAKTFKESHFVDVDLHYEISWLKIKAIDEKCIWKNCRKVNIDGVDINVPSIRDELHIVTAHSVFQHHYTTLGESYYMLSLLDKLETPDIHENDDFFKMVWDYNIIRKALIYNDNSTNTICHDLCCKHICDIIIFHPLKYVPRSTLEQFIDFLLTIYRRLRFSLNGELPYNQNWMAHEK